MSREVHVRFWERVRVKSPRATRLPLYRQSQILARAGLDLHRAVLAMWVGKAAFHLKPVVDRLAEHLKRSGKLFMDETSAPVLDPGRGATKTGYLWALARDDRPWGGENPPGVVYFYAPDRAGVNAETFLTGFDGILQIDGYTGYNRLSHPSRKGGAPIRVAHCELCLNLGDAHFQAARLGASKLTSTPSLNLIPSMTFGN